VKFACGGRQKLPGGRQILPVARRAPAAAHHDKSAGISGLAIGSSFGTALARNCGAAWQRLEQHNMHKVA
jgi:hypothetical protein